MLSTGTHVLRYIFIRQYDRNYDFYDYDTKCHNFYRIS